jgi:Mg/Co/Ni transporter MgtE
MEYEEETAGSLMTTDYLAFPQDITVDEAIKKLREYQPDEDMAYYLYVVDSKMHLEGIVSLRNLIVSQPDIKLSEIMVTDIAYVEDTDDEEVVAEVLNKYGLLAVPVVDEERVLVGTALLSDVVSEVYRPHRRKGLLFQ